eukprot:9717262-Heterocapsa_arctica.AAC.1
MPLPLPQQCEATAALAQRLDGHGDQRLAGIGAWLYVVTIMLNFMNAGHGELTEAKFHTGRISAGQHEFHRRLKIDV